jgi:preprotein translocase subunit YajC
METAAPNPILNILPIAAIFIIFYFLLIRPQQQEQKKHEQVLKNLKPGDKVLTTGGLYGTIVGFKGDDLEVQFSQTVKLTVARSAVARLVSSDAPVKAAA